jgi:5'-nucleotidase
MTGESESAKIVNDMISEVSLLKSQIIGLSNDNLYHVRVPNEEHDSGVILKYGSLLAPVICDIMQWKANYLKWRTDGVFINAGSIKKDILKGEISYGTILEALPYTNHLALVSTKGIDIISAINHGIQQGVSGIEDGAFPYTSRIRFKVDFIKQKAIDVEILKNNKWGPIEPDKTYRLITYSYLAEGGNGFDMLNRNKENYINSGISYSDIFLEYLEKHSEPITAKPLTIVE